MTRLQKNICTILLSLISNTTKTKIHHDWNVDRLHKIITGKTLIDRINHKKIDQQIEHLELKLYEAKQIKVVEKKIIWGNSRLHLFKKSDYW